MPLNNPATAGPTHQTDETGSRALDAVYQNTTGVTLYVSVVIDVVTGNAGETARATAFTDAATPPTEVVAQAGIKSSIAINPQHTVGLFVVVLPGNYYKVGRNISGAASATLTKWVEWY